MFESYRSVGLVSTGPLSAIRRLGDKKNFFTSPVGRSFYVYSCENLRVSLPSRPVPMNENIHFLVSSGNDLTYVCAGKRIFIFRRAECVSEFLDNKSTTITAHEARIELLCLIGDVLLSLDIQGTLKSWDCKSHEKIGPDCNLGSEYRGRFLLHPQTYLNKVLIGGESGLLQIWNFKSGKLIHSFQQFQQSIPIACAEQSPALDVVALGLADGTINLFNLRFDQSQFKLRHVSKSRITSLTFLQGSEELALLSSGAKDGEICIWDLNKKTILFSLNSAHSGSILSLRFIPGEFVLLSCGSDNSLKSWEIDPSTYQMRILRGREGHAKPPHKILFHPQGNSIATLSSGMDGRALQVLSAGLDSTLRSFHCSLDHHAKELSQKNHNQNGKLPIITSLASSEAREKDWFNVVTTHVNDHSARVWSFENNSLGEGRLHMRSRGYERRISKRKTGGNDEDYFSTATCCILSNCGNFAFVGSSTGIISQYNLQSGRFVGSYPKQIWEEVDEDMNLVMNKRKKLADPSSVYATTGEARPTFFAKARDSAERHVGSVNGLCIDGLDEFLFSIGYDGMLRVWEVKNPSSIVQKVNLSSPALLVKSSRDGGLFAVALENFSVVLFDSTTRKIVRLFKRCHQAQITDVAFSPNSRWLLTSSMDTTLRVFDLSTSRCIDWMRFPSAVTSLSFSPSNEYLATTHVDNLAICLWANKVHFGSAKPDKIVKKPIDKELPCFLNGDDDDDDGDNDEEEGERRVIGEAETVEDVIMNDLTISQTKDIQGTIVLSEVSSTSSRWFTLCHLEFIKERNKPIQPPEKPQQAPFFLPTTAQDLDLATKPIETAESKIIGHSSQSDEDFFMKRASALSHSLEEVLVQLRLNEATISRLEDIDGIVNQKEEEELDEAELARMLAVKKSRYFHEFVKELTKLSPSAIDFEIRTLSFGPEDEEGARLIKAWLEWISYEISAGTNFELIQSILSRLIKIHGESLDSRYELKSVLEKVQKEQKSAWKNLQSMLQKSLSYVESFSSLNGF